MGKISQYSDVVGPKLSDKLIGTSVGYNEEGELKDVTYNFTLQQLLTLFIPNIPTNTLQGVLDNGNTATQDINLFGKITVTNLDVTDTANLYKTHFIEEAYIEGLLFDSLDLSGTTGQILSNTGSGVKWITPTIFTPTLQQVLEEGNTADIDIVLDADIEANDIKADNLELSNNLKLDGRLYDSENSSGVNGQVLISLGNGVEWQDLGLYVANSPLFINPSTKTISIQKADSTQDGYLSRIDWINFDGKQNQIVVTTNGNSGPSTLIGNVLNIPQYASEGLMGLTVSSPLQITSGVTPNISIPQATGLLSGFLSSTDWNTFNSKQNALNGTGIVISNSGVISYITDNSTNWNTAYNNMIVSAAVTGLSTKTLTLTQQDGGTITASWSDIDTGLTSVGISMPSAFTVSNSPLTSNGVISITAAGNATQYIRGDGALATLPTNIGGGGASVSYYLNGSVNQGTIGGVTYYELSKTPILGAGTDFSTNTNGYIASFLTDAGDPNLLKIPAGNWNFETYFQASSGGGNPTFYVELYKYDGTTFSLIASNSSSPKTINDGTNIEAYFSALSVPETTLTLTDRLAIRIYVVTSGRTITLHTENNTLCQVITTFSTGLTALNGLTTQVQYFSTGVVGTDFNIVSLNDIHTFNLPTASAVNRGALSSADWSTFNSKQGALTLTTVGTSGAATLIGNTLNIPQYSDQFVGTVTSVGLTSGTSGVTIGSSPITTSGNITLSIATANGSQQGLLSSTDWNTFNNKQAAGNYITSLIGEATATGPGASTITLNNVSVIAKVLTGLNITGGTVLSTDSILTAFGKVQNQINGLIGGSIYQGTWNANTNTPTLTSSVGTSGHYYIVNVAGSTNLNGISDWKVGDWAIFNGGVWQKVDNTDAVSSVNGEVGAVSLTTDNIPQGTTNLYFANNLARAALSFAAGSGAYNNTTGVITIPTNTNQLTNGASFITLTSLSAGAGISYNNTTGVITSTITQYTNALARAAISLTTTGTSGAATYNNTTGVLNIPQYSDQFVGTVTSVGLTSSTSGVTIGSSPITTSGNITLSIATASGSQQGLLSATDWTTFNSKQNALTNPVTGTGTTNYLPKFTGTSTIGNSAVSDDGTTVTLNSRALSGTSASFSSSVTAYGNAATSSAINSYNTNGGSGTAQYYQDFGNGAGFVAGRILRGNGASGLEANGLNIDNHTGFKVRLNQLGGSGGSFTIDGGNLGLGVTPSAWAAFRAFDINTVGTLAATTDRLQLAINSFWNGSAYVYKTSNFASRYDQTSGQHQWFISPSGTAGNAISFTQAMTLNASGNLGIGTTSPSVRLEVVSVNGGAGNTLPPNATAIFDQAGNNLISISGGSANEAGVFMPRGTSAYYSGVARLDTNLIFRNNDAERIRITSSGNVGIGTTDVDSRFKAELINVASLRVAYNGTSVNYYDANENIFRSGSGSERMRINSLGNVGIGTTSPAAKLEILGGNAGNLKINNDGSQYVQMLFERNSTANSGADFLLDGTAGTFGIRTLAAYPITFSTSASAGAPTERMRITSGGNVGIGTTTPIGNSGSTAMQLVGTEYPVFTVTSSNQSLSGRLGVGFQNAYVGTITNHPFYIITNDSAKLTVTTSGNVGIGTTSPTYKFEVSDGSRTGVINPNSVLDGIFIGVTQSKPLIFGTSDTERMRITSSGNVGIGTTAPQDTLDVRGIIRGLMPNDPLSGAITAKFLCFAAAPFGLVFRGYSNGTHSIQSQRESNNSEVFALTLQPNGGNVGINTTSPSSLLTVNGDIRILSGASLALNRPDNGAAGSILLNSSNNIVITSAVSGTLTLGTNATFSGSVTATAFFASSDITLKNIIKTNYNPTGIEAISYKWKDSGIDTKVHVGYSAQQVQEFMPDAVSKDSNGKLSVNYVEVLVAKIAALEAKVKQLEAN